MQEFSNVPKKLFIARYVVKLCLGISQVLAGHDRKCSFVSQSLETSWMTVHVANTETPKKIAINLLESFFSIKCSKKQAELPASKLLVDLSVYITMFKDLYQKRQKRNWKSSSSSSKG